MPLVGQGKGMDPRVLSRHSCEGRNPCLWQGKGMDPRIREDDGVAGLTVKVIEININALKAAINTLACDLHQQA